MGSHIMAGAVQEQDPSMEEILQSIKRIIAEDGSEDGGDQAEESSDETAAPASADAEDVDPDDVLELTDEVKDDGSVVNVKEEHADSKKEEASPEASDSDGGDLLAEIDDLASGDGEDSKDSDPVEVEVEEIDLPKAEEAKDDSGKGDEPVMPDESFDFSEEKKESAEAVSNVDVKEAAPKAEEVKAPEAPKVEEAVKAPAPAKDPESDTASSGDALLSDAAAAATSETLRQFMSNLPKQNGMPLIPLREGRTLEDLVIEAMTPMLKDWLDKNLQKTVERIVEREIRRIMPRE